MSLPAQLVLDLPARTALEREDFFEAPSNALAVARIDLWREWPQGRLLLLGRQGAGKSHLASVWAKQSGAAILTARALDHVPECGPVTIEDVDRIAGNPAAETALFHAFNQLASEGRSLLLTSGLDVARAGFVLPDLVSRLQAMDVALLAAPDEALLSAILLKLFRDRQLNVTDDIISYITDRMERSFSAAHALVAELDRRALAGQRAITKPLVRQTLQEMDQP